MASCEVESLFENTPLQKNIDLFADILFHSNTCVDGTCIDGFTEEHYLWITPYHYVRIICSIWRQMLPVNWWSCYRISTAAYFSYHEQGCLENSPLEFIPVVYKRYEDDALLLFRHG